MIQAVLIAPEFLYRVEVELGPWETAARLSYFLWGSTPDEPLLEAAQAGRLVTEADILLQTRRMMEDVRARRMASEFHWQWLGLAALDDVKKDRTVYPMWRTSTKTLLKEELERFLDGVFSTGDLGMLLTAPQHS